LFIKFTFVYGLDIKDLVRFDGVSLSTIFQLYWWSVLLVEETGVPRENHRPVADIKDEFIGPIGNMLLNLFFLKPLKQL
jgi:hypothetical protein